jgi:hypothetical protein
MLDRKHSRRSSNQSAVIHMHANGVIMCTVADISDGGAGITVSNTRAVPDTFELEIKGEHARRNCKVAWRKEPYHLGVSFL